MNTTLKRNNQGWDTLKGAHRITSALTPARSHSEWERVAEGRGRAGANLRCFDFLGTVSVMLVIVMVCTTAAAIAAEPSDKMKTSGAPGAGVDLLDRPLESVWKHFSEDPKTALSEVWQVREGVLVCRGAPKGYLYLDRDLTDFTLRLEWRWPPGKKPGNAGVLVRTTGPHKIWPRSLEAQLNAGQAGDFWGLDAYSLDGPSDRKKALDHAQFGPLTHLKHAANLEKPAGEWNEYEIIADGSTVVLMVNGKEVNRAARCEVIPGKICLTAEGDEIHFRNLRLIPQSRNKSSAPATK